MLSKYGNCTRLLKIKNKLQIRWGRILDLLCAFFTKQLFHSRLLDMRWLTAIYDHISNPQSWNNCRIYINSGMRIAKGYGFPTLLFIYEVKVSSLVSSLLRCRPSLPILSTHSKGIELRGMVHKMRLNFFDAFL